MLLYSVPTTKVSNQSHRTSHGTLLWGRERDSLVPQKKLSKFTLWNSYIQASKGGGVKTQLKHFQISISNEKELTRWSYQRRNELWSLSWRPCCLIWTRFACCCTGRWWPQELPCRSTSHEALSQMTGRSAPQRSHTCTPAQIKYTNNTLINIHPSSCLTVCLSAYANNYTLCHTGTHTVTERVISPHFPPAQRLQTAWICDTELGPLLATRSFCWEGIP